MSNNSFASLFPPCPSKIIEGRVESTIREKPEYEAILSAFSPVFQAMSRAEHDLSPDGMQEEDVRHLRERIVMGAPAFSVEAIVPPIDQAVTLYEELLGIFGKANDTLEEFAARQRKAAPSTEDVQGLIESFFARDLQGLKDFSDENGVEFDTLLTLMRHVCYPFRRTVARWASDEGILDAWEAGNCPCCGEWPALGELRAPQGELEGARWLVHCLDCGCAHEVERMRCVRCGEEDQQKRHYLFLEEEKHHRVNVCESCKGYLVSILTRIGDDPLYPPLEVLLNTHLDLAAQEEGWEEL